jgi:hypothetical protein
VTKIFWILTRLNGPMCLQGQKVKSKPCARLFSNREKRQSQNPGKRRKTKRRSGEASLFPKLARRSGEASLFPKLARRSGEASSIPNLVEI